MVKILGTLFVCTPLGIQGYSHRLLYSIPYLKRNKYSGKGDKRKKCPKNYLKCIIGIEVPALIATVCSNVVVTGTRPSSTSTSYGRLNGSTACLKIFDVALKSAQVNNVASACLNGVVMV